MLPALKQLYKNKGTLGVLEWIYDKKRFIVVKLALKTIFTIFPYESILKATAYYNQQIPKLGFNSSTKEFIKQLNISIEQASLNEIEGSCLIFGNHPTGLDPFLIAACLKRDDIYIVADVYQQEKGNNIGQHVIPIYYSRTQKNLDNRGLLNSIGFYVMRLFTGYEKYAEVKLKNQITIQSAAEKLREGHVVIIFPDGGSNNPDLWYNGIGEIIRKSDSDYNKIKLFATQIKGISTATLFKHFLFNKKSFLNDHPVQIILSSPLSLEALNIQKDTQSNEITERLRTEFITNRLWAPNYAYRK